MFPPLGVPLNPERCMNLQELCVFPSGFSLKPTRKVYIPAKKRTCPNQQVALRWPPGWVLLQAERINRLRSKGGSEQKNKEAPFDSLDANHCSLGGQKTQARIQQPRGDLQGRDLDHEAHVSPPPPSGISELDLKFVQIRRKRPLNPCSDRDHGVVSLFCVCVCENGGIQTTSCCSCFP